MKAISIWVSKNSVYSIMQPVIPISLKRLAVRRLADVRSGRLSRHQAEAALRKYVRFTREELITHLTREYNPQHVEALQFFRLL